MTLDNTELQFFRRFQSPKALSCRRAAVLVMNLAVPIQVPERGKELN